MGNEIKSDFPCIMWSSAHEYFYGTLNYEGRTESHEQQFFVK